MADAPIVIEADTHVGLDVRELRLLVSKGNDKVVFAQEYTIVNQNAALDIFEYLEKNKEMFASVTIV